MTNEELVLRIKAGEDAAKNMEVLYNQVRRFIQAIAWKYRGNGDMEDLEQEGYLALYPAIEGYDPAQGVKFLTYAEYHIRQRMQRYLQMACSGLRLPAYCQDNIRMYKRYCNTFRLENGYEPPDEAVAYFMRLTLEQVKEIRRNASISHIGSLDSPARGLEEEDITLGDMVVSAGNLEEDIVEEIHRAELKRELWDCVDSLEGQQPEVLRMRYQEDMSQSMIGQEYGITPEEVRKIHVKALRELRKPRYVKRLSPFLSEFERIYSAALAGNGVAHFKRTWTSSTERVALKLLEAHKVRR